MRNRICPKCGEQGPVRAISGLCFSCHSKDKYSKMPPADCHPDRKEHCGGLCRSCYRSQGRSPRATCHKERPHFSKGLCGDCYRKLPEVKKRLVVLRRMKKYGLTVSAYDLMLTSQGGKCAICKNGEVESVDHNHKTGVVRGLLCRRCNVAIGLLRDDPEIINLAFEYVKKHHV